VGKSNQVLGWFCAEMITSFRNMQWPDAVPILVWGNIVLFKGHSEKEVRRTAMQFGERNVSLWPDVSFLPKEEPMLERFEGIRQVVKIDLPDPADSITEFIPTGTVIMRSLVEVSDIALVEDLVAGKSCPINRIGLSNLKMVYSFPESVPIKTVVEPSGENSELKSLWFCAHVYTILSDLSDRQFEDRVLLIEDIVLLNSKSIEDALLQANRFGRNEQEQLSLISVEGQPMKCKFAGVRKVIKTDYVQPNSSLNFEPSDGTEVTFSQFEIAQIEDVKKLVNDENVLLLCKKEPPH
jgi:hypothetical protein